MKSPLALQGFFDPNPNTILISEMNVGSLERITSCLLKLVLGFLDVVGDSCKQYLSRVFQTREAELKLQVCS